MIGRGVPGAKDALLAFRYECKYLVDEGQARAIRQFIRPFVRTDGFAAVRGADRYPVCSLYLDTPGLLLYHQSLHGVRNRYKLRIRAYSDDPAEPLFLEIKRRVDGTVLKRRCPVGRTRLAEAVAGDGVGAEFAQLARRAGCAPVMRVRYLREAYESAAGDPVRMTFDTDLGHAVTLEHDLSLDGPGWRPTPVGGTVLEIKFTDRYPGWVRDLLRLFDLQRLSLPKYGLSMTRALAEGRYPPRAAATAPGARSPARRAAGASEVLFPVLCPPRAPETSSGGS